jgi:peptidylprolyl isomerase
VPDSRAATGAKPSARPTRGRRRSSQDRTLMIAAGAILAILALAIIAAVLRNQQAQPAATSTPLAELNVQTAPPGATTASSGAEATPAPSRTPRPAPPGDRPLAARPPAERNGAFSTPPPMTIDPKKSYTATIATEVGDIVIRLFPDKAPKTVNSFVFLARQGFYDGVTFHRVLENFMAQTGDPLGTGTGGPGYEFEDETENGLVFDKPGLLGMAHPNRPDSNGSQFFITFVPTSWLDGIHTVFGEVVQGMDVLSKIRLRDPDQNPTFIGTVIDWIDIQES